LFKDETHEVLIREATKRMIYVFVITRNMQ
jgi:hypothetical protein